MVIVGWLQSLWRRAVLWFRPAAIVEPVPDEVTVPVVRRLRREAEHYGAHYYLGDLLDRLDHYFKAVDALHRVSPDRIDDIKRFGCSVLSDDARISSTMERSFVTSGYPTFGCVFDGRETGVDGLINPDFLHFVKMRRPINVQASNYVVYECGLVYRLPEEKETFIAFVFHASVSPDCTIRALKECSPTYYTVGKRGKRDTFARMEWSYPPLLMDWAERRKQTPDEVAREVFSLIVNAAGMTEYGIAVRARKGLRTAAFSIDMLRTPYFFADREKTVNENGQTKRILHLVRPHVRANGKAIKAHFRGLRRFNWNGYDVSIGLPGRHYRPLMDLSASAIEDADPFARGQETTTLAEFAAKIDERLTAA